MKHWFFQPKKLSASFIRYQRRKVMVISRDADNGFLALITFSAEDTDTDTDTDTGNLHTLKLLVRPAKFDKKIRRFFAMNIEG